MDGETLGMQLAGSYRFRAKAPYAGGTAEASLLSAHMYLNAATMKTAEHTPVYRAI